MLLKIQVKNGEFTRIIVRGKNIINCVVQIQTVVQSATSFTEVCLENHEFLEEVQLQSGSAISPYEDIFSSVKVNEECIEALVIGGKPQEELPAILLSATSESTPEAA